MLEGIRRALMSKPEPSVADLRRRRVDVERQLAEVVRAQGVRKAALAERTVSGTGDELGSARIDKELDKGEVDARRLQRQIETLDSAIVEAERRDGRRTAATAHLRLLSHLNAKEAAADELDAALAVLARAFVKHVRVGQEAYKQFPRRPRSERKFFEPMSTQLALERLLWGATEGLWRARDPGLETPSTARTEPSLGTRVRAENAQIAKELEPRENEPVPPEAA